MQRFEGVAVVEANLEGIVAKRLVDAEAGGTRSSTGAIRSVVGVPNCFRERQRRYAGRR
jgi:hypothetical protein